MTPKVSVAIATYNHERYVRDALEGALSQKTTFPFEIVVGDDASTDGTRAIIEEYEKRYSGRVRAFFRDENAGDGGLTNYTNCMRNCRGQYIATLDGDDYWTDPQKLQLQAGMLDATPKSKMCFHACKIEAEGAGRESREIRAPSGKTMITTEDLLVNAMVSSSSIMMRREFARALIRSWPSFLSDWFVGIVASRRGPVGYIDRVMSVYRQHANASFGALSQAEQWAKFMGLYEQLEGVLGEEYHDAIEEALCVRSYLALSKCEEDRDLTNARKYLTRALRSRPAWLEPYCACYGMTGDELLRRLHRRVRTYRFPLLFPLWLILERLIGELRWLRLRAAIKVRLHQRLHRGESVGYIFASPNPARSLRMPGRAAVNLTWTSAVTKTVEVRLGRPNGPLVSHSGPAGGTRTGEWVADGTIFYLQDVGGSPLTREHTLGAARIRVKA